jgi:hypothetical protein
MQHYNSAGANSRRFFYFFLYIRLTKNISNRVENIYRSAGK